MSKIKIELTQPQIAALLTAACAMMAGEEGEGDFLCSARVLQRAIDALQKSPLKKRGPSYSPPTTGK